ncbi:MAG: DUF3302 domain-containing protein [Pseudomonadota bacterium]|nr:DUF3302 domain-containing protein [Pseudomonadota bacterium]
MLNYIALGVLIFVALVLFYGIIALHDIPYEIAKHRNHPQQDAIHVAGWVSLFTLHIMWPFLWIWASLYREDRGWGFVNKGETPGHAVERLEERNRELSARLQDVESALLGSVAVSPSSLAEDSASDFTPSSPKSPASPDAESNQ